MLETAETVHVCMHAGVLMHRILHKRIPFCNVAAEGVDRSLHSRCEHQLTRASVGATNNRG
jgi:hypothetical protein